MRRIALALVAILLLAGLAAVGLTLVDDDIPYERDSALVKRIEAFSRSGPEGATRRLAAMTDFAWDTVYVFREGSSYRDIDDTIGAEVFGRDGRFHDDGGIVLFFTRDGRFVHGTALGPPVTITAGSVSYPRNARLRARTNDPGPYGLEIVRSG